jgi:hypothetical protein
MGWPSPRNRADSGLTARQRKLMGPLPEDEVGGLEDERLLSG